MKPFDRLSDDDFVHLVQRAVALPDVPPQLAQMAIRCWERATPATLSSVARAGLRYVSAALSFDSWAHPPVAFGMRAAASDTRHLLFSAKGRDVDLRISAVADQFALTGQILGPDLSADIELVAQPGSSTQSPAVRVTSLNAMGEFRLDNVSRGTYVMTLITAGEAIVLPPIEVGATPS